MLDTNASFDVADFDRRLVESALGGGGPELGPALLHTLEAGGKRIRALLVHEFGALCGAPGQVVGDLGLAIEFLHAATLVHDDVIDQAETRRGRPALQRQYGVEVALLVGDLYVARCGVHLARAAVPAAAGEVWKALDTVVRGEIDQRSHRFDFAQTAADYLATIECKTASLLEAACSAAVIAGGAGDGLVEAARTYAHHLGLAFQIVDDVLDYTGRPEELGKPVGNDIREGTVTLPLILAMEMSTAPLRKILASARERSDFGAVVMAVQRSGAIDQCLEMADQHSADAVAPLQVFAAGTHRDGLEELARALPSRRA